jgi:hypothetical protein
VEDYGIKVFHICDDALDMKDILDPVHNVRLKDPQHFRDWICLHLRVESGEGEHANWPFRKS